jgi:hypothetical protein
MVFSHESRFGAPSVNPWHASLLEPSGSVSGKQEGGSVPDAEN